MARSIGLPKKKGHLRAHDGGSGPPLMIMRLEKESSCSAEAKSEKRWWAQRPSRFLLVPVERLRRYCRSWPRHEPRSPFGRMNL